MQYIGLGLGGRPGTHTNNAKEGAPGELATVTQAQSLTAPWLTKVETESAAIGDSYPAQVQAEAQSMANVLQLVGPLRTAAINDRPASRGRDEQVHHDHRELLAIDDNIALGSGDPSLNNDVRALNLVSLIAEEASEQRGLLAFAFAQDTKWTPRRSPLRSRRWKSRRPTLPSSTRCHPAAGSALQQHGVRQPGQPRQRL